MIAYHGKTEIKTALLAQLRAHYAADAADAAYAAGVVSEQENA